MSSHNELNDLALRAVESIMAQEPVLVAHAPGWQRNGFPLPMKRVAPDAAGFVIQEYRPLAILEYINDVVSGVMPSTRKVEKAEGQKEVE